MKPTNPRDDPSTGSGSSRASSRDELHNNTTAHEQSDINIRAVVSATVVVAVVCLTTAALMAALFGFLERQAEARDPTLSPLAVPATEMPKTTTASPTFGSASDPKLLTNEPQYLSGVRSDWQKELNAYGWVDQQAGVVRIPIDRAKELLAQRGLAVRAEPIEDPTVGTHAPAYGESSSGRTITKPASTATAETPAAPAQQKTEPPKNPADHGGAHK
jgi:hypothetical protein